MKDIGKDSGRYAVYGISIILLIAMSITSCNNKPNDKLKIRDEKYTISLGDITYNSETSTVTIAVLGNGKPLPNIAQYRNSRIIMDGEEVSSHTSVTRPVGMALCVNGRIVFGNEGIPSDDGVFTFKVDKVPEGIEVFTDSKASSTVYFSGESKEVISSNEYYDFFSK